MVELIDTHSHIFVEEFEKPEELVDRAREEGVGMILMPNIDTDSVTSMQRVYHAHPDTTRMMMGLHPCSVEADYQDKLAQIREELNKDTTSYCAIGEIGLDFYWSTEFKEQQIQGLRTQLQWATELNLPVSLHTRNATEETIALCREFPGLQGVFHCFGGTVEQAKDIQGLGMYIGLGGVLTFKNAGLAQVVESIPLDAIVLETDAPYLAPHPFRGKRNEPAYLKHIADKLAEVKGCSLKEVAQQTSRNAREIFRLP